MNQNPSQDPQAMGDDRPVPAPEYGQYIANPAQDAQPRSRERKAALRAEEPPRSAARRARTRPDRMAVTWTIIALCTVMWLLQWVFHFVASYSLASTLGYAPVMTTTEPWRMLTSGFVHSMFSPLHLVLNMYTLYLFGRMLEPALGAWRMGLLFVLSVLGGSLGVLVFSELGEALGIALLGSPNVLVIGASGGVFGLFGALFVFLRHAKRDLKPLTVLIVINLIFGFVVSGVAWQAHVGGLLMGSLVSLLMMWGLRNRP